MTFKAKIGEPMEQHEQAAWAAAYGAAFAIRFEHHRSTHGIDIAVEVTNGHDAADIADRAVEHLRAVMKVRGGP